MPAQTARLRSVFRWGAILFVLVALTWLAVIVWWQTTRRNVTAIDLLLYLLALPLSQFAALLLLGYRLKRRKSGIGRAAVLSDENTKDCERETLSPVLPLLAAWAVTSLGGGRDFLQGLQQQRIRPRPDPLLTDDQGFPLMCGRVLELDTSALERRLAHAEREGQMPGPREALVQHAALLRTVTLLDAILDQVLQDWPLPIRASDDDAGQHPAGLPILRGTGGMPKATATSLELRVKVLMSATLDTAERQFVLGYLRERMALLGIPEPHSALSLVPTCDDADALSLFDELRTEAGRHALLLISGDSMLCPAAVEALQANGRLFTHDHPNGLMPGEAAFAVLALSPSALDHLQLQPVCHLASVSRSQRAISADAGGKPSGECISELAGKALNAADTSGDAIAVVVCDADHRASRTLECIDAMIEHTPRLDAIRNRLAVGEACGHLGAAAVPGLLAAAILQVADTEQPTLLLSVGHPVDRAAALLLPSAALASSPVQDLKAV